MCGRYLLTSAPDAIRRLFRYPDQPNFPPRYNIAPTQPVPIVRMTDRGREFALVRWGLLPSWVKDPKAFSLLINARGESVNEKPAFKNAMKRRRCLFPADGFYEWKQIGGRRGAFYAHPVEQGPVAFAGLYETWMGPNGEEVETAAIVTTQANSALSEIHHRAPVVVPRDQFDFWLDCRNVDEQRAANLLVPAPEGSWAIREVSPAVNKVANDSPALLEPYDGRSAALTEPPKAKARPKPAKENDGRQGSLF
jgi:putative SOS response-associated peptidase YedK